MTGSFNTDAWIGRLRSATVGTSKDLNCYDVRGRPVGTVRWQVYWPYGTLRASDPGPITMTDKLYTGQQEEPGDNALGLHDYNARFYSTTLGRFASADPVVPEVSERGLNRYAYVYNNPLKYTDPTGLCTNWFEANGVGCSSEAALNFIGCAFGMISMCGQAAPLEDMIRLSYWAIRQRECNNHVTDYVANRRGFKEAVSGIRHTLTWMTSIPLTSDAQYSRFTGVNIPGIGRVGTWHPVFTSADSEITGYSLDYSYIDFRLTATGGTPSSCCTGEKHGFRMHVLVNESRAFVSGTSIAMKGSASGCCHIVGVGGASLYNPDVQSLSVRFDLILSSVPQAFTVPDETHPLSEMISLFDSGFRW
jgi:RHS repeat-associated protein